VEPVYLQIERNLRVAIADGMLRPGERLPSVRSLALKLGLATNTVARAYAALACEGSEVVAVVAHIKSTEITLDSRSTLH
jgi:DNA-binding transcriptional regulator YhcF (GntR family)